MTLTQAELDRIANKYRSMAYRMPIDMKRDLPEVVIERLNKAYADLLMIAWAIEDVSPRLRPERKR